MGKRRLLIVGGMGYIGARLAQALGEYDEVTVTGRSVTGDRARWLADNAARVRPALFDSSVHGQVPAGGEFETVLNLGLPGAAAAAADPEGTRRQALRTSTACLELLEQGRAGILVHFSTVHVFGTQPRPVFEDDDAPDPQHPYARNHLACEELVRGRGLRNAIVLRATNMVAAPAHGELGDQNRLLFLDLCRQAALQGRMVLHNDGLSYRDFLALPDVVAALRALLAPGIALPSSPMNLSRGTAVRLDAVAQMIQAAAPRAGLAVPEVRLGAGSDSWRSPFVVSHRRLAGTGWRPATPLEDEIVPALRFFAQRER